MADRPLIERPRDLPLNCQLPDGPFRHVVLPRDPVATQEGEQAVPVAVEPLAVLFGQLGTLLPPRNVSQVEPLNLLAILPQVPGLQTEPIHGPEHRHEEAPDLLREGLQLLVERRLPEIVVDVPDEMDQTLLLPTRDTVVTRI